MGRKKIKKTDGIKYSDIVSTLRMYLCRNHKEYGVCRYKTDVITQNDVINKSSN